jgi:crotonobetainyl-CoA:carnitine CoA-transferase CaiB-like acyl-CoA transferase
MQPPLAGVRVVDLTMVWSGPYATMFLADYGAEVIRVENPWVFPAATRGIFPRPSAETVAAATTMTVGGYPDLDPGERPWNRNAMFNWHARNKLSMTLDVRAESGKNIFLRLIEASDVLVENHPAQWLDGLGLGYERLAEHNPRLVVLRMPGGGLTGPYRDYVGFGHGYEGLVGLRSIRGYPGAAPEDTPTSLHMDAASGAAGAFAAMLALRRRRQTGRGSHIDLSQIENLVQQVGETVMMGGNSVSVGPMGNRDQRHAPQGVYPCAGEDRWVVVSVGSDEEWDGLRRAMRQPEWAKDQRFATVGGRMAAQDELDQALSEWTRKLDRYEVFHRCQAEGVPAAPVMDEADAYADPQLQFRGFFRPLHSPHTGDHLYPAHGVRWTGPPLQWERAACGLGDDNEYVYKTIIGLADAEYEELQREGVHISQDYLDRDGRPL